MIGIRRDAVRIKEAHNPRFSTIALTICFVSIFALFGQGTEIARNSSATEENLGEVKLEFSLELMPAHTFSIGQLNLSPMAPDGTDQLESQPFVLTEVATTPVQEQTMQAPPQISNLQNSLYTSSLIALTALNVADYITTVKALKHKELEEENPAMKPIAKNIYLFTAVKLGVAALDIYILRNLYKKNKPLAWVLSVAANFAMSYVVANNLKMINSVQ